MKKIPTLLLLLTVIEVTMGTVPTARAYALEGDAMDETLQDEGIEKELIHGPDYDGGKLVINGLTLGWRMMEQPGNELLVQWYTLNETDKLVEMDGTLLYGIKYPSAYYDGEVLYYEKDVLRAYPTATGLEPMQYGAGETNAAIVYSAEDGTLKPVIGFRGTVNGKKYDFVRQLYMLVWNTDELEEAEEPQPIEPESSEELGEEPEEPDEGDEEPEVPGGEPDDEEEESSSEEDLGEGGKQTGEEPAEQEEVEGEGEQNNGAGQGGVTVSVGGRNPGYIPAQNGPVSAVEAQEAAETSEDVFVGVLNTEGPKNEENGATMSVADAENEEKADVSAPAVAEVPKLGQETAEEAKTGDNGLVGKLCWLGVGLVLVAGAMIFWVRKKMTN